jgi:hypothetical protein
MVETKRVLDVKKQPSNWASARTHTTCGSRDLEVVLPVQDAFKRALHHSRFFGRR